MGSEMCIRDRFMRSGHFINEAIGLDNNANTVDRIRIFLYMPGVAVGSCSPSAGKKKEVPLC